MRFQSRKDKKDIDNHSQILYKLIMVFNNDFAVEATMMEVSNKTAEISICTGAACKAWDSEKIIEKLYRGVVPQQEAPGVQGRVLEPLWRWRVCPC